MLTDDQLLELLKDARAVDAMDGEFATGRVRAGNSPWRRAAPWLSVAAAAAIGVGLFVVTNQGPRGSTTTGARTGGPVAVAPPKAVDGVNVADKGSANKSSVGKAPATKEPQVFGLVATLERDVAGELVCVNLSPGALAGRPLNQVHVDELKQIGEMMTCDTGGGHRMVVAMEGPRESLPKSTEQVKEMAGCLFHTAENPKSGPGGGTCSTTGCVDSKVKMLTATLPPR